MRIRVVSLALAAVVAGCGEATPTSSGPPVPEQLEVEVLEFDPAADTGVQATVLSESPIHLGAFASWYAGAPDTSPELVDDRPFTTYLAAASDVGCRTPRSVELWRTGEGLEVRFVGGVEPQTCVQLTKATAYLAVDSDLVEGVRRINGLEPMSPNGPGELVEFVPLGPIRPQRPVAPVVLGTEDTAPVATMRQRLTAAKAQRLTDVQAALDRSPDLRVHQYAFVLPGCAETGALLLIGADRVRAELTGGENVACEVAEYFLATFRVSTHRVPEGAAPA